MAKLVQRLEDEGFLRPLGGLRFARIESPVQLAKKEQMYRNPMTLVGHCVSQQNFHGPSYTVSEIADPPARQYEVQ